ncbi:rhodanese-like domain-containing protein, partial [Blautia luti]
MGFFDRFKQSNINQGIEEYKRTDDAVLLDVRTPQEYQEGHIPESKNVPL